MNTACPNCQTTLSVPPGHTGGELRCPKCKHLFKPDVLINPTPQPSTPSPLTFLPIGGWFHFIGILSGIASILALFSLMSEQGSDAAIIGCFIWLALSFILSGIATIVAAVNANTRARENK